jgi:septal ring factor EnvC (AmiA/AmiB activator)
MPEPITTPTPHDGIPDSTVNPTYAYNGTTDRLSKVEGQVAALNVGLTEVNKSIDGLRVDVKALDTKIDWVEKGLNATFNAKIDGVEKSLNDKIDGLEKTLNAKFDAKIDGVEKSLSTLEKRLSTVNNIGISILVTFVAGLAVAIFVLFSQR